MGFHSIAPHAAPSISYHAADPLYRMRFPSYIRSEHVDEVPEQFRNRTLAVRAFDAHGLMLSWELVEGPRLEEIIGRLLAEPNAQYLRVHYAALDRYAGRVERK